MCFPIRFLLILALVLVLMAACEKRKSVEGSPRQTHHEVALATCGSGERAARHARARYDRRRWRFAVYPQEPDRREGWYKEPTPPSVSSRSVS